MQVNWPDDKVNVYRVMEAMALLHKLPADEYMAKLVRTHMQMIADTAGDDVYALMHGMLETKTGEQNAE